MPTAGALEIFASKGSHSPTLPLWPWGREVVLWVLSPAAGLLLCLASSWRSQPAVSRGAEVSRERREWEPARPWPHTAVEQELGRTGVEAPALLCLPQCPKLGGAGRRVALQPVTVSHLGVVMLCSPEDTEGHQNGARVLCKGKAKCQLASPTASRNA